MGLLSAAALLVAGCQQLALKSLVDAAILPANATGPWVTGVGDRAATLTWAEPSDSDLGAVQVVYQQKHDASGSPQQVVVAAGKDGATVALASNNVAYDVTVYMVDKAGHISSKGVGIADQFFAQLAVKTVSHYTGLGVGTYAGYDAYTYASNGMPSSIVTYDADGNPLKKHDLQYGPGSVDLTLDLSSVYQAGGWTLVSYENIYYDSVGRKTKTEYYSGPPLALRSTDTYSWDSSNNLTGWVSADATGAKTGTTSYYVLPSQEQWAVSDASGAVEELGQNDYDSAGHVTTVTHYDINMTITSQQQNQYDANGNLLKVTYLAGSPPTQTGYDVYGY